MPQPPGIGTDHHCPGPKISKLKGNCAGKDVKGYCTAHQVLCRQCGYQHLKIEPCPKCREQKELKATKEAKERLKIVQKIADERFAGKGKGPVRSRR